MEKKRILFISACGMRSQKRGLTSDTLQLLSDVNDVVSFDLFDTSFLENHKAENYEAENYYKMPSNLFVKLISYIPKVRVLLFEKIMLSVLKNILNDHQYDLLLIFQVQHFSDKIIHEAIKHNIKVALYPWGSEVLRAKGRCLSRLRFCFSSSDYLIGYTGSNILSFAQYNFSFPTEKTFSHSVTLDGVTQIQAIKGKYTRDQMCNDLGIPCAAYNIICGYNSYRGQQHLKIIDAIVTIKSHLPVDYMLVFPVSYGDGSSYVSELRQRCEKEGIHALFIERYISNIQMAMLHLLTDLYINIQISDNGNAFLIESLSCGNTIISGKWLKYNQFEQFGIPYYQCDTPDSLSETLIDLFRKKASTKVPLELIHHLSSQTKEHYLSEWRHFLNLL